MLSMDIFKTVIASTPLISIDFIVKNDKQQVLLGQRVNKPAKGYWFTPGGRILKNESLELAWQRLIELELGLSGVKADFRGVYQHFYDDNISDCELTTHYVVLAYEVLSNCELLSLPNEQHSKYRWFSESELLNDVDVHEHTKWYFQVERTADSSILNKNR